MNQSENLLSAPYIRRSSRLSMGGDDLDEESFLAENIIEGNSDNSESAAPDQEPAKKRRRKQLSPEEILIETGRRLAELDPTQQANFLNTAMRHFKLKENSPTEETDGSLDNGDTAIDMLKPQWLLRKISENGNLMDEIRNLVALKKLKHWRGKSPCVLIVCLSARRAVAILKDIADLKVRASKLFPKNGSVEEQREKLAVPIAVGTPHRLRQLKASWQSTLLVVLDAALSNKQFALWTLPETAQDSMAFLQESIVPEMTKRKSCRLLIV